MFGDFDELVFGLSVGQVLEEGLADAESEGGESGCGDEGVGGLLDAVMAEDELEGGFCFLILRGSPFGEDELLGDGFLQEVEAFAGWETGGDAERFDIEGGSDAGGDREDFLAGVWELLDLPGEQLDDIEVGMVLDLSLVPEPAGLVGLEVEGILLVEVQEESADEEGVAVGGVADELGQFVGVIECGCESIEQEGLDILQS